MIQSNIFNITKVKNGADANEIRVDTNIETIFKFPQSVRDDNSIEYTISPQDLIIGLSTLQGEAIEADEYVPTIYFNNIDLKAQVGASIFQFYLTRRYSSSSVEDEYNYYFHIGKFYFDFYDSSSSLYQALTEQQREIINEYFNTDVSTTFEIQIPYLESISYKYVPFQIGTDLDIATFSIDAARGIMAAMQGAGLNFDANGLGITNGNFYITNSNGDQVLNFDKNSQSLQVTGNVIATSGIFHGTIEAVDGYFNGNLNAATGNIGGFNITEHTIESNDLILSSSYTGHESYITVKNINIGTGANIQDYLNIGNLSLWNPISNLNYDNSTVLRLILPHDQITQDATPITNKKYYTKSGDNYNLFTGSSFASGTTYYEDGIYFSLNQQGEIQGNNWSIKKESGNNYVTARFGKLIAEDGEFNGVIHASDGVFTGEVLSSIISASTINTVNFVTEKARSMGGSFIFKPTFEITNIVDKGNNILELTLTGNNIVDYFQLEEPIVVAISGFDTRFGETDSVTLIPNNVDTIKVEVIFKSGDYDTIKNSSNNYNTLSFFGKSEEDFLIGINSDNTAVGNILPPRALTMENFSVVQDTENTHIGYLEYNPVLLLGDLSSLTNFDSAYKYINGYGLYADNVFLHGSLMTRTGDNSSFAGINTQKTLSFNPSKWGVSENASSYNNDKIIFWGGANSLDEEDIQSSPFIVTDKGNIFARNGEFKGTVISDSVITQSVIKAPIIYGSGRSPSLKIYNTNEDFGGIGFYKLVNNIDEESNETNDIMNLSITNKGFTHYNGTEGFKFISFVENNDNISFNATEVNIGGTKITDSNIEDGAAHIVFDGNNSSSGKIELNYNEAHGVLVSDRGVTNFGGQVVHEGNVQIIADRDQNNSKQLNYKTKVINNTTYYCLYVN